MSFNFIFGIIIALAFVLIYSACVINYSDEREREQMLEFLKQKEKEE